MVHSQFWNLLSKKLAGEASPEEIEALEQALRENPDWAYEAGYLHKIWMTAQPQPDPFESELAFEEHLHKLKSKGLKLDQLETESFPLHSTATVQKKLSKKWWIPTALATLLLVVFGMQWLFTSSTSKERLTEAVSEVTTRAGSKTTLRLPDSSVVWLNAGSRISYNKDFGRTNRQITLSGEAFFDVRKTNLPFVIHTNDIKIKVLGTAFNVKSYPNEKTITSLIRGAVEVTLNNRPGEKYVLKPKEKLVIANSNIARQASATNKESLVMVAQMYPNEDSLYTETSWVDNKLLFQDESFQDLAIEMERWYGVRIFFKDESVARQRLSGSFTTETIQEAMEGLRITTPFNYQLRANVITIDK